MVVVERLQVDLELCHLLSPPTRQDGIAIKRVMPPHTADAGVGDVVLPHLQGGIAAHTQELLGRLKGERDEGQRS